MAKHIIALLLIINLAIIKAIPKPSNADPNLACLFPLQSSDVTGTPACGRNGPDCRFFQTLKNMYAVNCAFPTPHPHYVHVDSYQCSGIPVGTKGECKIKVPTFPMPCAPTDASKQICVLDKVTKQCRIVKNTCVLENMNFSTNGTYQQRDPKNCGNLKLGDAPKACIFSTK